MKNYNILLGIISLLCSIGFCTAVAADDTVTIRVGIYENQPKIFTDKEGNASGFWPDVIKYIAVKEGWKIEYIQGTWSQCLERLKNGEIDIMPDVAYTDERNKLYAFSKQTVYVSWSRVYTRAGTGIESILDLEGKNIAVLKDSVNVEGPEGIKSLISKFAINCTLTEVDSYIRVFELVESGEADAGVTSKDFGNQHGSDFNVVSTAIIFQPSLLYFAFPQKSNLVPYLTEIIDYHIKQLKEDQNSIYYQSLEKWLGAKPLEKPVIPGWMKWTMIGIGALVFLLAVGSYMLRSQVRARTKELTKEVIERRSAEYNSRERLKEIQCLYSIDMMGARTELAIDEICQEAVNLLPQAWQYPEITGARFTLRGKRFETKNYRDTEWKQSSDVKLYGTKAGDIQIVYLEKKPESDEGPFMKEERGLINSVAEQLARIIEARQAQEVLRESEERIRLLLDSAGESIYGLDLNGNCTFVNKACLRTLGYKSDEDVLWKTMHDLIHYNRSDGTPYPIEECKIYHAFRRGEGVHIDDEVLWRADGSSFPAEYLSHPIRRGDVVIGGVVVFTDTTERKKAMEALRESELKFRTLLENVPQKIFRKDKESIYVVCNRNYAEDLKILPDEIVGKTDHDFFPSNIAEKYITDDKRVMESGETEEIEEKYIFNDHERWVHTVKAPVKDKRGNVIGVLGVFSDITERKEMEKERQENTENLLKSMR
jgi:PAS domain S-box-containing protein